MSRRVKASLAAIAVAIAFVAAVIAAPAGNSEAGSEPVAFFLGRMIESS